MSTLSVTWENFRGFERSTMFQLPRITVLIGRNNVGKTSAYTPLLAMRQTLQARDRQTALLSRGQYVDIGPYKDYVFNHEVDRRILFRVRLPNPFFFHLSGENLRLHGIEVEFDSSDGVGARVRRHRIFDEHGKSIINRTRDHDGEKFTVTSKILPSQHSVGRPLREITGLRKGMREEQPRGYLFDGVGGLRVPRAWRQDRDRWIKARDWFDAASDIYDMYSVFNSTLISTLRGISYLGPLRSLPLRTYRLAAERPSDVGKEGEFAPEMLYRLGDGNVKERVDRWLTLLGYGKIQFEDFGEEYFRLNLKTPSGLLVNYAHSGVGLSQLLPLLVQGVTLNEGSTFIAQQPEIHLNPAQQCIVTDFLIESASQGRRVVVETHSEHVLLRLRRRMAENSELTSSDVAVYFFDNRDGRTHVERIPVADNGDIARDAWPEGFFSEQLSDSLALALAQSRGA